MPSAWSYARVSSLEQAASGAGLQRQHDDTLARAWCDRNGYQFMETFAFTGSAYSGRHLRDGAPLRHWIDQAIAGQLGPSPALLVEEIDRFTRQAGHRLLGELAGIFAAGIVLVSLRDGVTYSAAAFERDDRLLVDLMDEIRAAHRYSVRLSRRLSSYWQQARDRVAAGEVVRPDRLAPWWISADGDRWILNDRAPIARAMFDRALEVGSSTIAREFNAQGVPPVTPGRAWTSGGITRHLRNPAAYGLLRLQRAAGYPVEHPDYFPALVSREQWELVQRALERRQRNPSARAAQGACWWIGQRLTRCSCGAPIETFCSTPRPGQHYRYLRCSRRRHEAGACNGISYRLEAATAHLLTRLQPAQLALMLNRRPDDRALVAAAVDAARQAVELAEQQRDRAVHALEAAVLRGEDAALLLPIARRADDSLTAQRQALADALEQLAAAEGPQLGPELAASVSALLASFAQGTDTPEQRRAVQATLQRLGLVVLLDPARPRLALQIGDGEPDWQPVDPELGRAALAAGAMGATFYEGDADGIGQGVEWAP
jgi:DNA invertase Pin-like site-specific DNA recombinase